MKLDIGPGDAAFGAAIVRGLGLAESTNLCRTLSQTPPNVATPFWMAEQAQKLSAEARAFLPRVVAAGSLRMTSDRVDQRRQGEWREQAVHDPAECARRGAMGKPIVLIGKTMTYDTGGLSLKINNGMVGMKRDKDGGCAAS